MKLIDLTVPLGIGTPAWPTYEPLQMKYFKRLPPNGADGQPPTPPNTPRAHTDGGRHRHPHGWDHPESDEIRYMVKHPGPDREFAEWCRKKKLRWLGVDCGSADHPMKPIIRTWMPRRG